MDTFLLTFCPVLFLFWDFEKGSLMSRHHSTILQNPTVHEYHSFPETFVWGAATSSYQIEGAVTDDGRGPSIWDTFCKVPGNVLGGESGDVACDHYHKVDADVNLMKRLGLKAYRFSIAWPRILPNGEGEVNQAGIDFYSHLIDRLIENGIEPWITLYHWDLPQVLEDKYKGWLGRETVDAFGEYTRICFAAYGDRVKHWITLNESWTVAVNGYNNAIHAPGHFEDPGMETYLAAHHLILAHARAAKIYKMDFADEQGGVIGISNCADFRYPLTMTTADEQAAERAMVFQLAWFADPIWKGDYPKEMKDRLGDRLPQFTTEEKNDIKGSSDFFGLNHYSSLMAAEPKEQPTYSGYWADMFVDFSAKDIWERNQMGWSVVPDGCRELLLWISKRYDHPTIYMTENGSAKDEPDLQTALHDYERLNYFKLYITACAEAMDAGTDLRGYFAWSFMDNVSCINLDVSPLVLSNCC
jgi:beta-galactosidase